MRSKYVFSRNGKTWASIWSDYKDDAVFKFMARLVEQSNKDFFDVFKVAKTPDMEEQLIKNGFTIEETQE